MKTYRIQFIGVTLGALGKPSKHTLSIEAKDWREANLKIYDTHEHIRILKVNGKPYSYEGLTPTDL